MPDQRKIFGLNRNIFILGLTSFFNDFSNEMIHSAFPAFFTSVLKSGAASLGLVEGIADGAANFLRIYSGNLSDKISKRRIFIFIGYSLAVIVRPLYIFVGSVGGVLGLRVTDRIGKGIREAPRDVIISVSAADGEKGRSFGYHRAMDAAGGILGPFAAFLMLEYMPGQWGIFFLVTFVIGLIAVATIFYVKEVVTRTAPNGSRLFSWKIVSSFSKSFKYYLLAIFILSIGSLPTAVLLLKTTSIGLVIASIPLFYMLYSVSFTLFSFSAGKLSDRIGTGKVIILGYTILIISYIGMAWANSPIMLGVFYAIMGIFSACTDSTQRAHVANHAHDYERGTAYGLLNAAIGFGAMISGIAGGYIWQHYSANTALLVATISVVVGLMVFWISRRMGNGVN
jgi:MFS family permease